MAATGWIDSLAQDVRHALRTMRRAPAFTAMAILVLALGIGVNATVVTATNAVLFKGRPLVERSDRLVYLHSARSASYPDYLDWRARATSFSGMAAVTGLDAVLSDDRGLRQRMSAGLVSANAFSLLGVHPVLGRDFSPSDEARGALPVVLLTHQLWESRYASDPGILGLVIRINAVPTTVIGVMPQGFLFPDQQALWMPLVPEASFEERGRQTLWFVVGRLADGVSVAAARAEIAAIGEQLASAYPATNKEVRPAVVTAVDFIAGDNARTVYWSMSVAVSFVLLIACANLANLTLARAMGRTRELSLRVALGASRTRIVRQLLTESMLISCLGGLGGWVLARWGVRAYALFGITDWRQPWFDVSIDSRVVFYLIAVSIGTGVLFGLTPALTLSRLDMNGQLKEGGSALSGDRRTGRLSKMLVAAQVALAVVLLSGAGMMLRSFLAVYAADAGVDTTSVLTMGVNLDRARFRDGDAQSRFFAELARRAATMPGAGSVAIANALPTRSTARMPFAVDDDPITGAAQPASASIVTIGPHYFETLSAAVLSGRDFTDRDKQSTPSVALVNKSLASALWPGADPVGKRVRLIDEKVPGAWLRIVGVVSNIKQNDATLQTAGPVIYLPFQQRPTSFMWVFVRTMGAPAGLASMLRHEFNQIDPDPPAFEPQALTARLAVNYRERAVTGAMFFTFALLALFLASVGLYGVVAHSISQRVREIGIRMAIGATTRDIVALVMMEGLRPAVIGLMIGLAASVEMAPVLRSLLVGVKPADPSTFVVTSLVLLLVTLIGCGIPARRAVRVDPVMTLRQG